MDNLVLRLEEVRAGDTAVAGGKGAHLGELAAHGFPVPPGFVVSALACREFFDALNLRAALEALEGASGIELAQRSAELRRRVVQAEIPAALGHAIARAHARLLAGRHDTRCAVRSSATAEDLAGASFAGQHGTYYYVTAVTLLEMVRHCWASLLSPEAVAYRALHGIPHASVAMAVVVQEMVRSEISGVTFTANPLSGDQGEIVIESSWGMGAALVDGRVTPDRYLVGRDGLVIRERRVAEKRFMVPSRVDDGGTQRVVEVPHALRRRETLQPEQVTTVAEWSLRCEQHFGAPQDVEWAIAEGRFSLLQSRPITTLAREEGARDPQGAYVLFKPLVENFTDPLTPLTADLLLRDIGLAFRVVHGRPYMNLAYLRPLVPLAISDEDLAEALYLGADAALPRLRLSLRKLPLAAAAGTLLYLVFATVLARTRGMPDDFMNGFRALCRRVEADPRLDPVDALRRLWLLSRPIDPIGERALLVNCSAIRFAPWMALLKRMLRRWAPDLRPDALSLLCSGSEGILSAEMGRALWSLAMEAKRVEVVRDLLSGHQPDEALARLRQEPAAEDFLAQLDAFLAVHGHRAVKEFELQSPRWDENPTPVLGMVRNYLLCESAPARQGDGAAARAEVEAEIRQRLRPRPFERRWGLRWRLMSLAARRTRYYLKLRENSRFFHIMAFAVVRKKVLALESLLLRSGQLKCRDDVFFLRWDEIADLHSGRLGWLDVEDRIRERRIAHVRFAKMTPPRTMGIERRPPRERATAAHELAGQCASPGRYEGLARVILDPSVDLTLRPGEVLVAPYTDPAWTPLFLSAGAAVVEVGSYLSHAGTVAREFGMPCVVDVADCTRRIRTGMRLDVDGDSGLVRILDQEAVA